MLMYIALTVIKSLWDKVFIPDNATECDCWEWTGRKGSNNYGIVGIAYHQIYVHRIFYAYYKGTIGKLEVCHTCDCTLCVNPSHLFLGTKKNNAEDREKKGRGKCQFKAKLSLADAEKIKKLSGLISQRVIGKQFGVSQATVSSIILGEYKAYKC